VAFHGSFLNYCTHVLGVGVGGGNGFSVPGFVSLLFALRTFVGGGRVARASLFSRAALREHPSGLVVRRLLVISSSYWGGEGCVSFGGECHRVVGCNCLNFFCCPSGFFWDFDLQRQPGCVSVSYVIRLEVRTGYNSSSVFPSGVALALGEPIFPLCVPVPPLGRWGLGELRVCGVRASLCPARWFFCGCLLSIVRGGGLL